MTTKPLAAWTARTAKRVIAFVALAALAGQLSAATVTGIIKDRRGNLVSTNLNFRSLQRPIFIRPWIQPGWNVSTNSDTNGVFTVSLTAGEYGVAIGSDQRDSFIIAVPNTSSNYTLAQVITSRLAYTYTFSPQYEQLLNRNIPDGYAGLDSAWGRLPAWLLGTNSPSAGDTIYTDGQYMWWAAPGTGSGADASIGYVVTTSNTLYTATAVASNALSTLINAAPTTAQLLAASNALTAKIDLRLLTTQFLADSNNLVSYANGVTNSSLVRQTQLTAASNALVALIGSGGAGNALTNNEARDVLFNAGVGFNGPTTNNQIAYFQDDIVQGSGNAATLGNVSVAGTLTVGAATVATLNNLATSSNALRSAFTTELLGASNALTAKIDLRVAVSDFLLASNALRNDIDTKVTTSTLNIASNAIVTYANGTTNSSIVRQTQLTAASNDLYSAIATLTTAVGLKANTTDLVNASNVVSAKVDLRLLTTQFLLDSNTLQTAIDSKVSNSTLLSASNALVSYANGTTNSSIVRQTQLTAASNAIVALIGSGSGNPLTNNDARDILFNAGVGFNGPTTNGQIAYFQDDIVQGSGNAATLGNVSVAGTLTVGAATVATLNNLATGSNALQTAITANDTKIGVASNALYSRVTAALTNNDTRAITLTSDFNVSGDAAFAGPVDVTGWLWPKAGLSPSSTNIMRSLTEDTAPATNDFLLSWDASANSLKQTALNSLPVSYRTQLAINAASNSILNGSFFQPLDLDLTDIAALSTTSYGINLLQLANGAAVRSYIGAVIGTDVQAQDAELAALAGLSSSEDRLAFWTGVGTASNTVFTAAARQLLDDVNAETMRTTLGIDLTTLPTHTQLVTASNALRTAFLAADTTTSNGLFSVETTRNAAVSNALAALVVANDTTTSNALVTLIDAGGGSSNTNQARFAYLSRYEDNTIITRSNRIAFLYWTGGGYAPTAVASNFYGSVNGLYVTNAVAGYYEISAGYSFSSPSNNVFAVMVQTNASHALNLIGYTEYFGGTGAAATTTNSVAVSGVVYLPANTYVSAFSDYTKSASGAFNFTTHNAYLIIRPIDSASSTVGSYSGSGGSATNALTWIASNAVPVSGSVTGVNFTLSSGLLGSFTNTNGRIDYGLAIDTSILPTHTQLVAASNAIAALLVANDTTTSNALRTAYLAADITTSNGVVSVLQTRTNFVTSTHGQFINTNFFGLGFTNAGSNAVQVIDLMGPQIVDSHLNGNTTIVLTNMPAWTNAGSAATLHIVARHTAGTLTIAAAHPIAYDEFNIESGKTNDIWITSLAGKLRLVTSSRNATNLTLNLPELEAAATNDVIEIIDTSTATRKKLALANLNVVSAAATSYDSPTWRRALVIISQSSATPQGLGDSASVTSAGTVRSPTATNGVGITLPTGSSLNNSNGVVGANASHAPGTSLIQSGVYEIFGTTNASRHWVGYSNGDVSSMSPTDWPTTRRAALLRFTETNSNWWFVTCNGSACEEKDTGVGATGWGRVKFKLEESIVPGVSTNWIATINGTARATNSTTIPRDSNMRWLYSVTTLEAAAKTNVFEFADLLNKNP